MPSVAKIIAAMRDNPRNIGQADLAKCCERYFGPPRTSGGSHAVFKTRSTGDPWVNIENEHGANKALTGVPAAVAGMAAGHPVVALIWLAAAPASAADVLVPSHTADDPAPAEPGVALG